MKIHHLNCLTMCPIGGRLINDAGGGLYGRLVCHCLLIESPNGLVLVDTGVGTHAIADPRGYLSAGFARLRPALDLAETALHQIEGLGFGAKDVRHIVLTHMDLDHAGGLPDFPEATVHVLAAEHDAANNPQSFMERERYNGRQWAHGPKWQTYAVRGEPWHGFQCVRDLVGLPPEILLVPVTGHSRGHCAVAVETERGWLLHCGDAYFHTDEMHPERQRCPLGLTIFQALNNISYRAMKHNKERLRRLARDHAKEVTVFCAHDPSEFEQVQRGVNPRG